MSEPGPDRILITEQSLEARLEGVVDAPHWDDVDGKPSVFPPSDHGHDAADITGEAAPALDVTEASVGGESVGEALDGKAGTSHSHPVSDVDGLEAALSDKSDRGHSHAWGTITGKPGTYTPDAHGHAIADVDGLGAALDGKADSGHTHTAAEVGLGNVDNTADAAKPVSTATQAALDGKAATGHTHTKAQVGLGNVDNTSDADKPVSTATQAALTPLQSRVGAAPATWRWNGTTLPTSAAQVHAQARVGDFIVAPNLTTDPGWHQITGV